MILPSSYETILDKIRQDWFMFGWDAAQEEADFQRFMRRYLNESRTNEN